jgi:hypothetical protein
MDTPVRVVARNADGSGCVMIMLAETLRDPLQPETDAVYQARFFDYTQTASADLYGKPYVDTMQSLLPPPPQENWRLVDGQLVFVAAKPQA